MKRFFNWMTPNKDDYRNRDVYIVERIYWQEEITGWEPEDEEFIPTFNPVTARNVFFDEVKSMEAVENVYKEDGMLIVYGAGETVSLPLWYDLPRYISLRYRAVRGKTVFTCGTEEEVFNYLKGATGKELDPDTLVIDRTEFQESNGGFSIVGAKFFFHYEGTEGIEAYIEIGNHGTDVVPATPEPVSDEEPEQMPF